MRFSLLNKTLVVLVSLTALISLGRAQTTYNAYNDFYVNVAAPGGFSQSDWIANVGVYPGVTGLVTPNTWGYAGGNFNGGDGIPSSVGTYLPASGGFVYPLTLGGTYAGQGISYLTGGTSFWIGYNDQYGTVGLPNAQTQIGKYTASWFEGAPLWTGSLTPNTKFVWLQGTGLSPDTDGLGAMLTWTAPTNATFIISGSYATGNYGPNTTFAIVDSKNDTLLAKQTLAPASTETSFNFTRTYAAGDVIQFQVGTPAAAQGSPLGLSVNIVPVVPPSTNAILTLQTTTNLTKPWTNLPVTPAMITPAGELNVGSLTNTNTFYRLQIRTAVQ